MDEKKKHNKLTTFSFMVKEEIISQHLSDEESLAMLSAYIKLNGSLSFKDNQTQLSLQTKNAKIARAIYQMIQNLFKAKSSFTYFREVNLKKSVIYHIDIVDKVDEILNSLEIVKDGLPIYPEKLVKKKLRSFYISGVFLACGSVNSPLKDYHLEMTFGELQDAKFVLKLLKSYQKKLMLDFKLFQRKKKTILYLKKADQISDFLSLINASDARLSFEDVRITKDFLNSGNRLDICAIQNQQRSYKKAKEQIEYINFLKEYTSFSTLSEKEKILCILRLNNEDASYSELSKLFFDEYNIIISKSGINHLFTSIKEKAKDLEKKRNQN